MRNSGLDLENLGLDPRNLGLDPGNLGIDLENPGLDHANLAIERQRRITVLCFWGIADWAQVPTEWVHRRRDVGHAPPWQRLL